MRISASGMVGSLMTTLLQVSAECISESFENRSIFGKLTTNSVVYFFDSQCITPNIIACCYVQYPTITRNGPFYYCRCEADIVMMLKTFSRIYLRKLDGFGGRNLAEGWGWGKWSQKILGEIVPGAEQKGLKLRFLGHEYHASVSFTSALPISTKLGRSTWIIARMKRFLAKFLPARRYASAGLCDSDVSVCLSVRLSHAGTAVLCLAERKQDREMYTVW